jgi:hypothetical protein
MNFIIFGRQHFVVIFCFLCILITFVINFCIFVVIISTSFILPGNWYAQQCFVFLTLHSIFHDRDWWHCVYWHCALHISMAGNCDIRFSLQCAQYSINVPMRGTEDILFSWHCTAHFHAKDWQHSVFLTLHTLHCIFPCPGTNDIQFSWHCTVYAHARDWRHSVFLTLHCIFPCQGLTTFCFLDTALHIPMPGTDDILFSWHCTAYSYARS